MEVKMTFADLVPWGRNRNVPSSRFSENGDVFSVLHREMNRVFDDFARGFGGMTTWPSIEVNDTGSEVKVVAELPGMEQKDIEVALNEGVLTLKGEKQSETHDSLYSERWHGQFERAVHVGPDVDPDKVNATFKNGVLSVTLTKRPEAQRQGKRIPISAS
jgi:HSP20 family protein